jgi:hypothetical protein
VDADEPELCAADLAPGDRRLAAGTVDGLRVHRVTGVDDPDFGPAHARLWAEFGARGEMEAEALIAARLGWDPARPDGDAALAYELLVLRRGAERVALRDHTAAVLRDRGGRPRSPVVVHLSHVLVEPAHRGGPLAGWLRALPLQLARRVAGATGLGADAPVVLVAEMEHPDPADAMCLRRLRSYERAGFRCADPAAVPYHQPDFRPADVLGEDAPRPVPLRLVLRRVGREDEPAIPADELATVVDALYAIYARGLPERSVAPLRAAARAWTAGRSAVRLLLPTA